MTYLHQTPGHVLIAAAKALETGRSAEARALLRTRGDATTAQERLDVLLGAALEARLDGAEGGGNLYAGDDRAEARMIAAFELLAQETPLIRFGYVTANLAILEATTDAEAVHVVDVGIGAGTQWLDLIDRLASTAEGGRPRALRVTGVDVPDAAGETLQALGRVGDQLRRYAGERGVDFGFRGVAASVEELRRGDAIWETRPGEALAVNASLALHHVEAEAYGEGRGACPRDQVLRVLAAEAPRVLTLVEPEADHNHSSLARRVAGARRHYGLVFEILGRVLDADPDCRAALERGFFGREIHNIIADDGPARVERHEPFASWSARLSSAGFAPRRLNIEALAAELRPGGGFSLATRGEALQLCFDGAPVLDASAWQASES